MNIKNKSKKQKGLIIALALSVSIIVIFGVIIKNINAQEKKLHDEYQMKLVEKDSIVVDLEKKLMESELLIENSNPENREELSETTLDRQNKYIKVSNEFLDYYLNYDTNSLNERREKLLKITSDELINHVAPEQSKEENALSSDPTFSSEVRSIKTFVSNKIENTVEVISEVHYLAKSTEGESEVKAFVKLKLSLEEEGIIKVTEYFYYPINK